MLVATALVVATLSAQADPVVDYILHCSGCHMPDGRGLEPEVPTLHDTIGRMAATPEGRSYIVRVPGVAQAPISDRKLTELLNWMLSEFSGATLPDDFQALTVAEVGAARDQLLADPRKLRAELFPDL
ncbi:MAG: hypothetical protein R3192_11815 [Woeseiaceae bacterium]|nr:hypothetical protein [Woeseiaceae bacterium]